MQVRASAAAPARSTAPSGVASPRAPGRDGDRGRGSGHHGSAAHVPVPQPVPPRPLPLRPQPGRVMGRVVPHLAVLQPLQAGTHDGVRPARCDRSHPPTAQQTDVQHRSRARWSTCSFRSPSRPHLRCSSRVPLPPSRDRCAAEPCPSCARCATRAMTRCATPDATPVLLFGVMVRRKAAQESADCYRFVTRFALAHHR